MDAPTLYRDASGHAVVSNGGAPLVIADAPKSLWPTKKWWAATVTGVGALATLWVQTGSWTVDVTIVAIGLGVQRVVSWLTPNDETIGGVPPRK